jgi:SAM-dependent methyltransferase
VPARIGYDLAAATYATWHWTAFWRENEAPAVRAWLSQRPRGVGLDAGCGTGPYRDDIVEAGHRYVGLDISWQMLRLTESIQGARVQSDITLLPFRAGIFDWILSTRVLSHCPSPASVFSELGRVVKLGGHCLITDVHPAHPYDCMSLSVGKGVVPIETFKHRVCDVLVAAGTGGFTVEECLEYRLADLPSAPPRHLFEKVYRNPTLPIFYLVKIRQTSGA